jgi:deoxyribodipyrimidine photo-lyase
VNATLLWLRQDLRIADHPALQAAIERGAPVIPVFLWCPQEEGVWTPGAASRWWLHHSLDALRSDYAKRGATLIIRRVDDSLAALRALVRETGADAVYWSRRYEPLVVARDRRIKDHLRADGLEARSFNAALLTEPWDVQNLSGKPFQVFTPYWRKVSAALELPAPLPAPRRIPAPARHPDSIELDELQLLPEIRWDTGMARFSMARSKITVRHAICRLTLAPLVFRRTCTSAKFRRDRSGMPPRGGAAVNSWPR